MRVSLWRQFSSNHSSRFTVVGEFETPEAAQKMVQELEELAQAISKWYEENPAEMDERMSGELTEPTPPEMAYGRQHGIRWNQYALDWWNNIAPVTQFERLVFINGDESDVGAMPFDEIVKHLGGQAKINGMFVSPSPISAWHGDEKIFSIEVAVTCVAPDAATAKAIESTTQQYFEAHREYYKTYNQAINIFETPWHEYNPGGQWSMSAVQGKVRREDTRIYFEDLSFFHLGYGLPGLLIYLNAKKCREIEYKIIEIADD